ncbi:hypothetical protein D3C72_2040230 [compost metagenome]
MHRPLDIDAGARIADLSGIEEHAVCHRAGGTRQIGIIEHQQRRFAAEFQRDML